MNRTIVRVRTSTYVSNGRLREVKEVYTLKRKSTGDFDLLACELGSGYEDICIIGLAEARDGMYELRVVNESVDWGTGVVDDWELKLFPYVDETLCQTPRKR